MIYVTVTYVTVEIFYIHHCDITSKNIKRCYDVQAAYEDKDNKDYEHRGALRKLLSFQMSFTKSCSHESAIVLCV